MEVGDEEHIYSYVLPLDTTEDKTLKWTSSDDAKAIVEVVNEEEVIVKALSSGIVTITSESLNGVKKSIDVYIKGISLDPRELKLELKNSYDMNGILIDDDYKVTNNVSWESLNPKVAVVDSNGRVSAKSLGTTKIKITDELGNVAESIVTIIKIQVKHFTVSEVSVKEYSGKKIKPSVTVKYNGSKLKKDKDYTVSYSNNKTVGKATIKIKAKKTNLYEGSKTVYFIIKPKKVTIKTPTTSSKTITVKYSKQTKVSGYEVSYRLKGSSSWTTVKASGASKKITGLKKGKTYQVRVRSYVMVDNKKYSGAWSKTKSIKCK
jgi:hypothetical protein